MLTCTKLFASTDFHESQWLAKVFILPKRVLFALFGSVSEYQRMFKAKLLKSYVLLFWKTLITPSPKMGDRSTVCICTKSAVHCW